MISFTEMVEILGSGHHVPQQDRLNAYEGEGAFRRVEVEDARRTQYTVSLR